MAGNKTEERVLIVAPVGQDARAMAARLGEAGFTAEVCTGATDTHAAMAAGVGTLLLTEEALELSQFSELLLESLRAQPAWSEVPMIILTTGGETRLARLLELAASAAGSVTLLERPLAIATMLRSVEVALQSRRRQYQVRKLIQDTARLAAIIESSDDAIISKDLKGIIVTWNDGAERLFGYTAQEAIGRSITMVIPRDRLNEEPDILSRISRGERIQHYETVRQHKNGSLVNVSLAVSPIIDNDGRIMGASKIVRDITESKRAEAALHDHKLRLELALEAAQAASRAKDQFLATLSHELRTPLTPVLIAAAMLREDESLPAEVRSSLEMIEQNIELQAQMVDDLLDLSRITNNKLSFKMEPCDLHQILQRALEVCMASAKAKGVMVTLRLEASRRHLLGDPIRLQQVFWNLIQNAIKFTPEGGNISVSSHDERSQAVITVADTGRGIEPALLERIFEPFEQGHDRAGGKTLQGLGLGLAIARRFVAAHDGTLKADSKGRNQGATFTVRLEAELQPRGN